MNSAAVDQLIRAVIDNAHAYSYLNLRTNGDVVSYAGWTSDFRIYKKSTLEINNPTRLDLTTDRDLFLLFVLASCWSRTGPFENAAYFTLYVKDNWSDDLCNVDEEFINKEKAASERAVASVLAVYDNIARKKISFRPEFYDSVLVLANHWEQIKESLQSAERDNDYVVFIDCIRNIPGLGGRNKNGKMRIKIPLILRELTIAGIFKNIPKEWCCVPDTRVLEACKKLNIRFSMPDATGKKSIAPRDMESGMRQILDKSQMIYSVFGELYDIALFAHRDLFPELYPQKE